MGIFENFSGTRIGKGLLGAFCLWWSYDTFVNQESCQQGYRLSSLIMKGICFAVGNKLAAVFPLVLALYFIKSAIIK
jgi:hypothetical protein